MICDCAFGRWVFMVSILAINLVRRSSPSALANISNDLCVKSACMGGGAVE